jgi:hypothetical protein
MDDQHIVHGLAVRADEHDPPVFDADRIAALAQNRTRRHRAVGGTVLAVITLAASAVVAANQRTPSNPPATVTPNPITTGPSPITAAPGQWVTTEIPGISADTMVTLSGVAAISAADAWAVGAARSQTHAGNLAVHWDGRGWQQVSTPAGAGLFGVTARAANDVWAVGTTTTDGGGYTAHWNGHEWTQLPSPAPADLPADRSITLFAVTARAADDVWAVGCAVGAEFGYPIVQHWDGKRWSASPIPMSGNRSCLRSVSARAADDVWAVGFQPGTQGLQPLALHWNGNQWSTVDTAGPLGPARTGSFTSVIALAANDVWAFGGYLEFAQHWNGTQWQHLQPPPGVGIETNAAAVDGRGGILAAVGGDSGHPALLRWNGTAWTIIPGPPMLSARDGNNPGAPGLIAGLSRARDATLWAVGMDSSSKYVQPLAAFTTI